MVKAVLSMRDFETARFSAHDSCGKSAYDGVPRSHPEATHSPGMCRLRRDRRHGLQMFVPVAVQASGYKWYRLTRESSAGGGAT